MLALTRKSEYALIAACHLARNESRVVSAREIASHYAAPLPLLMNLLKTLQQAGLVRSERGARGGYSLAVPPAEITLARLVAAIEGPVRLVRCRSDSLPDDTCCELIASCPVRLPLMRLQDKFEELLRGLSVADIAFDDAIATVPLQPLRASAK